MNLALTLYKPSGQMNKIAIFGDSFGQNCRLNKPKDLVEEYRSWIDLIETTHTYAQGGTDIQWSFLEFEKHHNDLKDGCVVVKGQKRYCSTECRWFQPRCMEKETTCERFVYAYAKTERKVTELMESIKKNYSEEKWPQRMAMINSGKCVNTESHENDKLFKNDSATNAKGKSMYSSVGCTL